MNTKCKQHLKPLLRLVLKTKGPFDLCNDRDNDGQNYKLLLLGRITGYDITGDNHQELRMIFSDHWSGWTLLIKIVTFSQLWNLLNLSFCLFSSQTYPADHPVDCCQLTASGFCWVCCWCRLAAQRAHKKKLTTFLPTGLNADNSKLKTLKIKEKTEKGW